jgi:hypothetical protein
MQALKSAFVRHASCLNQPLVERRTGATGKQGHRVIEGPNGEAETLKPNPEIKAGSDVLRVGPVSIVLIVDGWALIGLTTNEELDRGRV